MLQLEVLTPFLAGSPLYTLPVRSCSSISFVGRRIVVADFPQGGRVTEGRIGAVRSVQSPARDLNRLKIVHLVAVS